MATNHITKPVHKKRSALDKFHIAYEYDRTWNEAKNSVQLRPSKK